MIIFSQNVMFQKSFYGGLFDFENRKLWYFSIITIIPKYFASSFKKKITSFVFTENLFEMLICQVIIAQKFQRTYISNFMPNYLQRKVVCCCDFTDLFLLIKRVCQFNKLTLKFTFSGVHPSFSRKIFLKMSICQLFRIFC